MLAKTWQRIFSFFVLSGLLLSLANSSAAQANSRTRHTTALTSQDEALGKIEPQVIDEIAEKGQTDFFAVMETQADLSSVAQLSTKLLKGEFVYNTLRLTADQTQKNLRAYLDKQGVAYTSYYIANMILVRGGSQELLMAIASRPDVAGISANHTFKVEAEKPLFKETGPEAPAAVEPNLSFVNADDVWALGITGEGIVLAGNDTGLAWTHAAIQSHYRGWDGTTADHNYNWWSAVPGSYPEPMDGGGGGYGYGTMATGLLVGDDGAGNQIGMAPGAKTIHCKNQMNPYGESQDAWYIECFEWDLAPWDLNGNHPRVDMAPDAVNVSWSPSIGGGNNALRTAIDNLQAAGILVEVSSGDMYSYICSSLNSPADYQEVLTTGSVSSANGTLPGTLSNFSGRGPSALDGNYFPDVMAPGENIRSSNAWYSYSTYSTTKAAGAHAAGLVGLMWSANPALRGMVDITNQIIQDTAVPLTGQQGLNCGGDYTNGPNNDWGYGTIDALAAVQAAIAYSGGFLDGRVTDSTNAEPLQGVHIRATQSITRSFQTTTDITGYYNMPVITGTYTVTATTFGYLPGLATGIVVTENMTTTQDFALDPAPSHVVSVTIVDANTGWPLYAKTSLGGTPYDPVWNNPVTGHFEVSLPDGGTYTFGVDAWTSGYLHQDVVVGPFYSDIEVVVELKPDPVTCDAPGYEFTQIPWMSEDFEASNGGYTVTGYNTSWEWGAPTSGPGNAHSGANVWATNLSGDYNSNEYSDITSPLINLSSYAGKEVTVYWWQWLQTQDCCDFAEVEISNDGGSTWTYPYQASGSVDLSWTEHSITLDSSYAVKNFLVRFHLSSNDYKEYLGWYVDDVVVGEKVCTPMEGGLVVGNVYDANEGLPIVGAEVNNGSGSSTLTAATEDPNVDDSFYVLFSPPGPHQFTASYEGFGSDEEMVDVVSNDTIGQDFYLTAGHLVFDPLSMQADILLGSSLTETLAITNNGSTTATYVIADINKGSKPMLTSAAHVLPSAPAAAPDVLLVCSDDGSCDPIRSQLLALGDIGSVDYYDAFYGTPSLDDLLAYDVVLVWSYHSFANAHLLGDVLADYVDAGGKVVELMFAMFPGELQGRFVDDGYTAMGGYDSIYYSTRCLGNYDSDHPIMKDVTWACDLDRLQDTYLTSGSTAVAYWDDGQIFVAAKDDRSVVSLNTYVGLHYQYAGQVVAVVNNAILWLAGSADVPWLSEEPITGTVPVSSSQSVNVIFDAGEVTQPGEYYAQLRITSDTPYEATTIPVTMTVTPPDTYGKLVGIVQSLGYCDVGEYPLDGAAVYIESSLGYTWTLKTDSDGYYQVWMDAANSPLTITVTADEHLLSQVTGVIIYPDWAVTTQDINLRWLKPCISETPASFSVDLLIGDITTTLMTLTNTGADASSFEIHEVNRSSNPAVQVVNIPPSDGNFKHTPASLGPAPSSNALTHTGASAAGIISDLVGEPAFAVDRSYNELVYIPDTSNPGAWNIIGGTTGSLFGGDFLNGDFSKMYVVDHDTNSLYTLDTATAQATLIGSAVPQDGEVWTGLTGSNYGILYGSASTGSGSTLYAVDPATGEATVIGPITNGQEIIDIAINADGEMYGVDIANDVLVKINPATGAGTVIGSLGVDANYAQGMDFDEKSGVLYWASWNYNVWGGELRVIDTTTGNSTSIGTFPDWDEVDCLAFANGGVSDVPWLSEDPVTGTLPADTGLQDITVTFDASAVSQPGEYISTLIVKNDDPVKGLINVPVTMTVNPTSDYGLLQGTVTGLGHCDDDPAPLEGAQVLIEASNGITYTVTTDSNGKYRRWLRVSGNDYIVSVTAENHAFGTQPGVEIVGLGTTTVDFSLRWLEPCVSAAPPSLAVDVPFGFENTVILNLVNKGAVSSGFEIVEKKGTEFSGVVSTLAGGQPVPEGVNPTAAPAGYVSSLTKSSYTPAISTDKLVAVFKDANPWDTVDVENFLSANGIPYEVRTSSEFGTLDFSNYSMIVFSADQPQSFYNAYASYVDKFTSYVEDGGFLNFFACDYGWNGGELTAPLPGGMTLYNYGEAYNTVEDPTHPVMTGISSPFLGYNIGYLTNLPAEAHVIATGENYGYPSIVEYPLGDGWLIAFVQALDYLHYYGYDSGLILENTLLWGNSFESALVDVPWVTEDPITGTITHDSSMAVSVTFMTFPTMTVGGVYTASLIVKSDDPANSRIMVPVTMTVAAPQYSLEVSADQAGSGEPGDVVTYTVMVTNTSVYSSDSYTVTLGTAVYATGLGEGEDPVIVIGPLMAGESATFMVTVHIPANAHDGDHDTVQITVTSAGDPTQTAITNITTNVYVLEQPPISMYLPLVWKVYP